DPLHDHPRFQALLDVQRVAGLTPLVVTGCVTPLCEGARLEGANLRAARAERAFLARADLALADLGGANAHRESHPLHSP
ncbi:MAG: pentapeptide repeat-containing protein, partial [Gemmatimonadota bacterium]